MVNSRRYTCVLKYIHTHCFLLGNKEAGTESELLLYIFIPLGTFVKLGLVRNWMCVNRGTELGCYGFYMLAPGTVHPGLRIDQPLYVLS